MVNKKGQKSPQVGRAQNKTITQIIKKLLIQDLTGFTLVAEILGPYPVSNPWKSYNCIRFDEITNFK